MSSSCLLLSLFRLVFWGTLFAHVPLCNLPPFDGDIQTDPHFTGITTLHVFDQQRGSDLEVEIWYPVKGDAPSQPGVGVWRRAREARDAPIEPNHTPLPLIVLSHGFGGTPHSVAWFAEILAANHFIVAAIKHHDYIGGDQRLHADHWNRALDISFILDELLISDWAHHIDPQKIGVAGFSLGGTAAIWIAGGRAWDYERLLPGPEHSPRDRFGAYQSIVNEVNYEAAKGDYRDRRVKSIFLMAPAWAWVFPKEGLEAIEVPVAVVAGANDNVVFPRTNGHHFASGVSHACFTLLPKEVGHYVFLSEVLEEQRAQFDPNGQVRFVYEDHPSINRREVHEMVGGMAVLFFQQTL